METPDASPAYQKLLTLGRELQLAGDVSALLGWDQEVLLTGKGVAYRGEQMAWLSGWIHEQFVDPEVGEWIEAAAEEASGDIEQSNVRHWHRNWTHATCLSKQLVKDLTETRVLAQAAWAEARKKADFSIFAPLLTKSIELTREKAERWGYEEVLYDALVDEFERGATTKKLTATLGSLRTELVPVVAEACGRESFDQSRITSGHYPVSAQEAFNREVAEAIGFDFEAGRIDTAVHPFCSGMGPGDTRLTTRYNEHDFRSSFFGVLHEAGHGLYEQGLRAEHRGQPVGEAASLGVHESQSRLWENHVGRSRAFWERWWPRAVHYFPHLKSLTLEEWMRSINDASLSHIRVEADEVTYDLHILLRFELEKAIFSGELAIQDIPAVWNERFESYFGLPVPSDDLGCLQDIHWSMGIFGYFPTYSLGNINAAHLMRAVCGQDSEVAREMDGGNYGGLLSWLRRSVHQVGSQIPPEEVIARAAGSPASSAAMIAHLRARYLG
jgi:carboxypeptidase Taq